MTVTPNQSHNPNPAFRPDPERGVFLSQGIDQGVLDRLVPTILGLQAGSRRPISVYIDSLGGSLFAASSLQAVLKCSDQDGNPPCRLITIATGIAGSAAADLLMAGDYALALPHARILCHGVSRGQQGALTRESAYQLSIDLANSNEQFAIQLATNCVNRFIFRVANAYAGFPAIRLKRQNPNLPDAACFIEFVRDKVSPTLVQVLESAHERSLDNDALDVSVGNALEKEENVSEMPPREFELHLLKAILDYEENQHLTEPNWRFGREGLQKVHDKLELLLDKYGNHHSDMISTLCARWGLMFLPGEQASSISQLPNNEQEERVAAAVKHLLRPLWFFFVSICRALQQDDYWMSAEEAYWLGLIDEVVGRTDLPSLRLFVEYPPGSPDDMPQPEAF
jgi:ATP-dependent protease ClpP protease subunit